MPAIKELNQTGYKIEPSINTQSALVTGDFSNWLEADLIQPKVDMTPYTSPGTVGSIGSAPGKYWGECGSIKEDMATVAGGKWVGLLMSAGGVIVTGSPNKLVFGGSVYTGVSYSGQLQGSISNTSLSVEQFDGIKKRMLYAAKVNKASIIAENGKPIRFEGSLIGKYSESASASPMSGVPGAVAPISALGATLTVGGTSLVWTELAIDFAVEVKAYEDASVAGGIDHWEVTNLNPKITVTGKALPIATKDWLSNWKNATKEQLIFTTGMGGWKALVQISSNDELYIDDIGNYKIVFDCVYDAAQASRLRLEY